jgi:FKBP-type peptidyl-prolyl cis-trans isomerase SlyD
MQLTRHKVGIINYTLTDKEDNILDESKDSSFAYLHGAQNIIPGLEKALEGKQVGDEVSVDVEPEDAYGERNLEMIQRVPKEMFPEEVEIKEGMQFHAQSSSGQPVIVTIDSIDGEEIVVDGNHPMAGKHLHFDVEIMEVRDATEEEISHGHVHGEGGHDH